MKKTLKKCLALLLCLATVFTFAACGQSAPAATEAPAAEGTQAPAAEGQTEKVEIMWKPSRPMISAGI